MVALKQSIQLVHVPLSMNDAPAEITYFKHACTQFTVPKLKLILPTTSTHLIASGSEWGSDYASTDLKTGGQQGKY